MLAARPWAVTVAVAGHLLLGAWLWLEAVPPRSGAVAAGSGGVELALGPAGGTAGARTPVESPMVQPVAELEPLAARPVADEVMSVPPTQLGTTDGMVVAAELQVPPAALSSVIDQTTLPAPDGMVAAPPEVQTAAAPTPPEVRPPAPVTPPEVRPAAPPTRTVKAAEPVAPPRPKPAPRPETVTAAAPSAPPLAASGKAGATDAPQSGSGDQSAGGGEVGDSHDYLATLAAWLERHKQYPTQARARREEGTVLVRFTIDRGGRLLSWHIDRGSGSAALDREVGTLLQRAEPLPPMPATMTQAQLELAVPIRFRLR